MKGAGWYAVAREFAAKSIPAPFIENGTDPGCRGELWTFYRYIALAGQDADGIARK
jgi:hypothetical protein